MTRQIQTKKSDKKHFGLSKRQANKPRTWKAATGPYPSPLYFQDSTGNQALAQWLKWSKFGWLKKELERVGIEILEVRNKGGKVEKYKITKTGIGDLNLTEQNLIRELENLAIYWSIEPPWLIRETKKLPPTWLDSKAIDLWEKAIRHKGLKDGVTTKPFGKVIEVRKGNKKFETKEQVVWIRVSYGRTKEIQVFAYEPIKKYLHNSQLAKAVEDYNYSMYFFVEQKKIPPDVARAKIKSIAKEVHRLTLLLIAVSLSGP